MYGVRDSTLQTVSEVCVCARARARVCGGGCSLSSPHIILISVELRVSNPPLPLSAKWAPLIRVAGTGVKG